MEAFISFVITSQREILEQLGEHLLLTFASLMLAVVISLPIGIWLVRNERYAGFVLGIIGAIQTVPSLALLGLLLPILGIGQIPAITALFLYALLPLVRNMYTGIKEIDRSIIQAARGMGLSEAQILTKVELPLAMPVIFAGVRTAAVINVGVATLASLIGAGGLGEFIFRGISLNNTNMLLAGAIPAALLALVIDTLLGGLEVAVKRKPRRIIPILGGVVLIGVTWGGTNLFLSHTDQKVRLRGGFVDEFMERQDGLQGLNERYGMNITGQQFESGLMFQALINEEVDLISGYSTDGRIAAASLKILDDDLHFFPPYHCAVLLRQETLDKYPQLETALNQLANKIDDQQMARLNYLADFEHKLPEEVARDFLANQGFKVEVERTGDPDIRIGSKTFTEQFIIGHLLTIFIENYTDLDVEPVLGMAGTKICYDALRTGEIDLYPEYTGTALLALLSPPETTLDSLGSDRDRVYQYVNQQLQQQDQITWRAPFGFNNTWAMMMRADQAEALQLEKVSDLRAYFPAQ